MDKDKDQTGFMTLPLMLQCHVQQMMSQRKCGLCVHKRLPVMQCTHIIEHNWQ